jgi:Bacterial PH domain/Short C-terminal domain
LGIVRTVEWRLVCSPEEADQRIRNAFEKLGLSPEGPPGHIAGRAKRSMMKNRWAADLSVDVTPMPPGSIALCKVDMLGNKHFAVLSEVAEAVGDEAFDDRGFSAAVARLGKVNRFFGRQKIRQLRNILRASETVLELGRGQYKKNEGLVVLTNERIFFFAGGPGSETVEDFPLAVIDSLSTSKDMTGETFKIYSSGNSAEISSMMQGQVDAIVRAFNSAKQASAPQAAPVVPVAAPAADDPFMQIARLGELRDKGLLSDAEFDAKKAEIIGRI